MSFSSALGDKRYWLGFILCCFTAGLYLWTLYPSVGYGDSGELIAAAYHLGINHPPSNPSYLLLVWAFGHIWPFGDFAYKVNLFSALIGTCTVALFFTLGVKGFGLSPLKAALLAGALAVSPVFWKQSTVAEVYLLNALLIGFILSVALLNAESRKLIWLFLVAGIGIGVHYSMFFILPTLVWLIMVRAGKDRYKLVLKASVLFLIGTGVMSYVYFRAGKVPDIDYGHIRNFSDFVGHIFWKQYGFRPAVPRGTGLLLKQFLWLWWIVIKEVHVILLLAVPGLAALIKKRNYPFVLFGPVFAACISYLFNYPSFTLASHMGPPKILPLIVWMFILAAVGLSSLASYRLAGLIMAVGLAGNLLIALPAADNSSNTVYHTWGETLLRDAQSDRSALFVEGDIDIMPLLYFKSVKGQAENITVIDRNGLFFEDIYEYERFPGRLQPVVKEKIEKQFVETFPGRIFYSHYPRHLEKFSIVPRGILYEVVKDSTDVEGEYRFPKLPAYFARFLTRPELLEYRERDILSRFFSRQARFDREADQKEQLLRKAAYISPNNPIHLSGLAAFLSARGDNEEALKIYKKSYEIAWTYEPSIAGYIQALVKAGDLTKAIEITERFRELDPENPYTLFNLAKMKRAVGDFAHAERLEEEASRLMNDWQNLLKSSVP